MSLNNELADRRAFFMKNFPMIEIGRERVDVRSGEILKNTCPVCGYLSLDCRDAFEICSICFWEDDGLDDYEIDSESEPNHMTLLEARKKFRNSKQQLLSSVNDNLVRSKIKLSFLMLDNLIDQNESDLEKITAVQNELILLFEKNKIDGIEMLI